MDKNKGMENIDSFILERAKKWSTEPIFDKKTRDNVQLMIEESRSKPEILVDAFYKDLEFGTGGMRGILGPGTAKLNQYNIWRASAALASELLSMRERSPSYQEHQYVGITYDSRHFSPEFARAAAEVFVGFGLRVYLTEVLQPVPLLSFLVREKKCLGGVCITASHNPPDYNGYKVYGPTGGQVTPPMDANIIKYYKELDNYAEIPRVNFKDALDDGRIELVGDSFVESYLECLRRELTFYSPNKTESALKIAFTPLHGTSGEIVPKALQGFGFDQVEVVAEQRQPDGNFPTVKFPNPEDPDALALAVALGDRMDADLVLGTDPDCDRIGIVVRDRSGEWLTLNGNQIGCLLTEFVLARSKALAILPSDPLVIKTIVTTDLQAKIAEFYGVSVEETLTGFKWICERIEEYESGKRKPYKQYVCGGEESFGFLAGRFVRDKDGVAACSIAAQMLAFYKSQGKTLDLVLDELFLRHGVYQELLYTQTFAGRDGASKIKAMMERVRRDPPLQLAGKSVVQIRDFEKLQEYLVENGSPSAPHDLAFPQSDVLQFKLSDHSKISVRPSGTEPKIKFYVSVLRELAPGSSSKDLVPVKAECLTAVKRLLDDFLHLLE